MIRLVVTQGPGHFPFEQTLFNKSHDGRNRAAFLEPLLEVTGFVQLFMQPGLFKCLGILSQFILLAARLQGFKGGLSGHGAGFDSGVATLDARCI